MFTPKALSLIARLSRPLLTPPQRTKTTGGQILKFSTTKKLNADNKDTKAEPGKDFRHNYPPEVAGAVDSQILAELNACTTYLSFSVYYARTDIAMPGCEHFFMKLHLEELEHSRLFINYQLMRGAHVKLFPVTVPEDQVWSDITVTLGIALEMEKRVKEKLECLYEVAEEHNDMQLMDLISSKCVQEQNEDICELGRLLTRAKRLVDTGGVGRHLFDKELFEYVSQKFPDTIKKPYI